MHIQIAFRVLGILMMMFSITMLPPVLVSLLYDDGLEMVFIRALSITLAVGFFLWLAFNRYNADVIIDSRSLKKNGLETMDNDCKYKTVMSGTFLYFLL